MPVTMPPQVYDHTPQMVIVDSVLSDIDAVTLSCRAAAQVTGMVMRVPQAQGCAILHDGKCFIWRIADADTLRHEYGHCNGWPADHPKLAGNPLPPPRPAPLPKTNEQPFVVRWPEVGTKPAPFLLKNLPTINGGK